MTLHSPWLLLLLLLTPLIWWRWRDPRRRAAILFSDVSRLKAAGGSARAKARGLLPLLRTAALVLLVVALARPQQGNEQTRVFSEGVAIQLVCDTSGSMNALDFELDGRQATRLAVVKKVVGEFIRGDAGGLRGRPNDLLGLVTFARYADSVCPLTLDHGNLLAILERVRAKADIDAQRRMRDLQLEYQRRRGAGAPQSELREIEAAYRLLAEEDGTAIGDAIGLGLERLDQATRGKQAVGREPIKSRTIILLTDGKQTVPDSLDPVEAARIAVPLDIRIHTILVGRADRVPVQRLDPLSGQPVIIPAEFEIDPDTLRQVAEATGGRFFEAGDTESLRDIYREIDKLERTHTDEKRYMQYTEKATPWLLAGFLCLGLEFLLACTLLRKIP